MYPIAQQAGLPRTLEIAGEEFQVSGITFFQLATLNAHLREATPHPVDEARALVERLGDLCAPEQRTRLIQDAVAEVTEGRYPPTFDTPEGERYFYGTPDGVAFYLHTVLSKHRPDLALDEVRRRIAPRVSVRDMEHLSVLIELVSEEAVAARKARAAGVEPRPEDLPAAPLHTEAGAGDPKAPTPCSA